MRYISEIIFLLVTTTAALTGEKINTSVLKSCKNSEVSLKTGQGKIFFARQTIPQFELKQKLKKTACFVYLLYIGLSSMAGMRNLHATSVVGIFGRPHDEKLVLRYQRHRYLQL